MAVQEVGIMNNDLWAKIWNAILIGCVIVLAIAVVILAVTGVESACGTPGDISCPPAPYPEPTPSHECGIFDDHCMDPYPAPPESGSVAWYRAWLPAVFGGE